MIDEQIITTERLILRALRMADAARIQALISDWNVLRTLSAPPYPYRLEHAHKFLAAMIPKHQSGAATVLALQRDDELIGVIGIEPQQRGQMLGYWLGHAYWGLGYMSEAASAMVAHFFKRGNGETLVSGYFAGNGASWRIQDKLGFRFVREGMLHSRPWGKALPHIDTVLTRERFEALKA
jgi:RimJ/RimL family protein N-acetyltransferase